MKVLSSIELTWAIYIYIYKIPFNFNHSNSLQLIEFLKYHSVFMLSFKQNSLFFFFNIFTYFSIFTLHTMKIQYQKQKKYSVCIMYIIIVLIWWKNKVSIKGIIFFSFNKKVIIIISIEQKLNRIFYFSTLFNGLIPGDSNKTIKKIFSLNVKFVCKFNDSFWCQNVNKRLSCKIKIIFKIEKNKFNEKTFWDIKNYFKTKQIFNRWVWYVLKSQVNAAALVNW